MWNRKKKNIQKNCISRSREKARNSDRTKNLFCRKGLRSFKSDLGGGQRRSATIEDDHNPSWGAGDKQSYWVEKETKKRWLTRRRFHRRRRYSKKQGVRKRRIQDARTRSQRSEVLPEERSMMGRRRVLEGGERVHRWARKARSNRRHI